MRENRFTGEPPCRGSVEAATPQHHHTAGGSFVLNRNLDKSELLSSLPGHAAIDAEVQFQRRQEEKVQSCRPLPS